MTATPETKVELAARKKLVQIKIIENSQEPFHLYIRKTGVFIRSFITKLELEGFLLNMPESRLRPPATSRKS